METDEICVKYPPAEAQWSWIPPKQQGIQNLGEFAVKERNKRRGWNMLFHDVYESWKMILAADAGDLYLLHLKAVRKDIMLCYEAIVWVEPKEDDTLILVSFKELNPSF